MQAYDVELTATAGKTYKKLHDDAQACIKNGDTDNLKVSLLASVDTALDDIISVNPFDSRLSLAGCLASVFALNHDSICVYYIVATNKGAIYVLYIGTRRARTDPSWLKEIVRSGKIDAVLERLGIDNKDFLEEARPPFLN